ncbi:S1 RNA-binding domain-containing protein [Streptomyces sp. G7(2002)]|uniref:S1 RNA-binding domain-containing protein n=1 Tax=Streptomyces sp. G7(2002) TaxID=2971798 RepID=UPI00237D90C1|nr:S1 RNA-binding domain-containing protein [Streptomyces sp. G7(2002)]WDT55777.1 S1 RNA-binding domain-containing protein [Streptomyces sp. G7(2002)]
MEILQRLPRPPEPDLVFFAMPYGEKKLTDGQTHNFDELYEYYYAPVVERLNMRPDRADAMYGTVQGVLQSAWQGIERASLVVVDFSARSASVAMEFGWAMCLHKRMVALSASLEDIPTDVQGQVRPILYSFTTAGLGQMAKKLQEEIEETAKKPLEEIDFKLLDPQKKIAARAQVVSAEPDFLVVRDVQNPRRLGEMRKTDVDYLREVPLDMSRKFPVGALINGTFISEEDGTRFTQRAGQKNPWPDIVETFPPGHVFTSRVVNRANVGAFISIAHGVNSLIPRAEAEAAGLLNGSEVEVVIQRVDPDRQKAFLALANPTSPETGANPSAAPEVKDYPKAGERVTATVARIAQEEPSGSGGYILVALDDWSLPRPVILHRTRMSDSLRHAFDSHALKIEDRLTVEVLTVRPSVKHPGKITVEVCDIEAASGQPELHTSDGSKAQGA